MKARTTVLTTVLLMIALFTGACGGSEAEGTPTPGADAIMTAAVQTFSAGMTQTALFAPTKTVTPTATITPMLFSPATLSNSTPFGTTSGVGGVPNATASCYRLSYVADVTIPDSTPINPGQTFTKTWKVRNSGSCAWDAGFKFAFTGGDNMQGITYTLPQSVPANTDINISIDMTAPTNKTGSLRSNWRMSTTSGQYFGDEVYVLITVGGSGGATATTGSGSGSTATTAPATATPTITATP
jgi:hypothetical protein